MWARVKCFLGLHDWEPYESTRWGHTIRYRKCRRQGCSARQRWHKAEAFVHEGYWA